MIGWLRKIQERRRMRLWVKALRSGEYRQGTGSLRQTVTPIPGHVTHTYCCLGVAVEVAKAHGVKVSWGFDMDSAGMLPETVREWYGLTRTNPKVGRYEVVCRDGSVRSDLCSASTANDDLLWDFNRIADGIEDLHELRGSR